jgi:hypothetical protein
MCARVIFPAVSSRSRNEIKITWVNSVSIQSSFKDLTDTAEVVLPRNIRFGKSKNDNTKTETLNTLLQIGDPIEIYLGYNSNYPLEFTGYIKEISTGFPITIRCEDAMYLLKRKSVSVSEQSIKLKNLLSTITSASYIYCPDIDLGAVRYSQMQPTQILAKLKDDGLYTYYNNDELYSGIRYGDISGDDPTIIELEKNAIAETLKMKEVPQNIYIREYSIGAGGVKLEATLGDPSGETYVFPHVGITSQDTLKTLAERDKKRIMQPGLDGDITLFGKPSLQHSMQVELISKKYSEKNGTYYIDCVKKEFNQSGYRQIITLGDHV